MACQVKEKKGQVKDRKKRGEVMQYMKKTGDVGGGGNTTEEKLEEA